MKTYIEEIVTCSRKTITCSDEKSAYIMVLIAQLLMVVIGNKSETEKSFANVITLIRLHLMSYVSLFDFIKETYITWRKANAPPNLFAKWRQLPMKLSIKNIP